MSYTVNKIIPAVIAEPEKLEENECKIISIEFEKDGVYCRITNSLRETIAYQAICKKDLDAILAVVNKINTGNPISAKEEMIEP